MDVSNRELLGAAAQQKAVQTDNTSRLALVPSEKNNALPASRKPQMWDIASRYKSATVSTPASPRWCPSPSADRTSTARGALLPKRAQSAERRWPSTTKRSAPSSPFFWPSTPSTQSSKSTTPVRDSISEVDCASRRPFGGRAHDGLWPSMRSLTTSFQSGSISIPVSRKEKPRPDESVNHALKSSTNVGSERKRTPLRGSNVSSNQAENSRPVENLHSSLMEHHRWPGISGGKLAINALSRSVDLTEKVNRSTPLSGATRGVSPRRKLVTDGSGGGFQQSTGTEVASQVPSVGSGKLEHSTSSTVNVSSYALERATPILRPIRTQSSPLPGSHRPSSPNKMLLTSFATPRGMQSPSRTRPSPSFSSSSTPVIQAGSSSSVLNYVVDARKGKKNANHLEEAHQLRLLHNRNLQWRFANALSDAVLVVRNVDAQGALYSVWNTTSELYNPVILKQIKLLHVKEELKLDIILEEQMNYPEEWAALEGEYSSCLSATIEALKASTLRLPVTCGAKVDVRAVKNAVSSAVDVMQAMGFSIWSLLSRVENMNYLAIQLSDAAMIESAMLEEARELLASTAALQVQECSLRTQLLQLRQDVHMVK